MAGTKEGSLKSKKKIIELYGEDFYKKIGQKGGSNGKTGGFSKDRELARRAGRIGGLKSKRSEVANKYEMNGEILTAKEWAKKLNVHIATVYSYAKKGKLKTIDGASKKINVVASETIHAIKLRSA